MRPITRHILPVGITAAFVFVMWAGLTVPIVAVFMLDRDFNLLEYLQFLLHAAGVSIGISLLLMFPLAIAAEYLTAGNKWLILAISPVLIGLSFVGLMAFWLGTGDFFNTLFNWPGACFGLSFVFAVYWLVLQGASRLLRFLKPKIHR